MTIELLEIAAARLDDLVDELVFVGGATIDAFITEPGSTNPRPTIDVDVVAEVATRFQYEKLAERLRARGFAEDMSSNVICRWRHGRELILDVMGTSIEVFGFVNEWYPAAVATAQTFQLPSGRTIHLCHPAVCIATKVAAFDTRGVRDPVVSRDLEDVIRIFDGRSLLPSEIANGPREVRTYLSRRFGELLQEHRFGDTVRALMLPDPGSQERADTVVLAGMRTVAQLDD